MARANKIQTRSQSNSTTLASKSLSLNNINKSNIAGSGLEAGKDTSAIQQKDHTAATEDEQNQELQAETFANGLAGVINRASLPRTRSSTTRKPVFLEIQVVIPSAKEPLPAAPSIPKAKPGRERHLRKIQKPADTTPVCESDNMENPNNALEISSEGNSEPECQIPEIVSGNEANLSLSPVSRKRKRQGADHHGGSRRMSKSVRNSKLKENPQHSPSPPSSSALEGRPSITLSQSSQSDGGEDSNGEKDLKLLEDEENASSSLKVLLEEVSVTIGKLGRRRTKKGQVGEKVDLDLSFWTTIGRQISRNADRLRQSYTEMWEAESAENADHGLIGRKHQRAIKNLNKLEGNCRTMLTERLGRREHGRRNGENRLRTQMLEDIYVHVVPSLVDALKSAGKPDSELSEMTAENIQEFSTLLGILHDVAERTRLQEKSIQPTGEGKLFYLMASLTHQLLPFLKKIRNQCEGELEVRRREKHRIMQRKLVRKRREREAEAARVAEDVFQQRVKERGQKITAQLEVTRKRLGLPPFTQPSQASTDDKGRQHGEFQRMEDRGWRERRDCEGEETHAAGEDFQQRSQEHHRITVANLENRMRQGSQPVKKPPSTHPRYVDVDDEESLHDDQEGDGGKETGYFGRNNLHAGTGPQEWSSSEIRTLVEGLRRDRGPTRYENLAKDLNRTLDEIFEKAKYFKAQQEYTLKRWQEEFPSETFPPVKPWIQNIGSERYNAL